MTLTVISSSALGVTVVTCGALPSNLSGIITQVPEGKAVLRIV